LVVNEAARDPSSPPKRHLFEIRLDGRLLCTSTVPFCDGARVLLAEGVDPATVLVMKRPGSDTVALTSKLSVAARLTVDESGPRFIGYRTLLPVELTLSAAHLDRRLSRWREDAQRDGAAGNIAL
jgi:hypothetical protein